MGRSISSRRGPLPRPLVTADDRTLTQFSGMVPVLRYLSEVLGIPSALRRVAGKPDRRRTYARHHVLFAFLAGALTGVHRLAHLEWLRDDAVLLKFLRLPRWPVRKVFSRALAGIDDAGVAALQDLVADVGLAPLAGRASAVVDLDSSAVISFGNHEGTAFGYAGKGRRRRRHFPLVASVAETRAVVHADYRDGRAIRATEATAFLGQALGRVRAALADGAALFVRGDSGFWSRHMGDWLLERGLDFVFSMPLRPGVKLMLTNTRWKGLDGDPDIQLAVVRGDRLGLDPRLRVIGIRRRIHDPTAPPQGKRIAHCTRWRYQALVTSLDSEPADCWRFYNDRADCERVFRTARQALGMGCLIGHALRANEVAFLLRLLAYNADLRFATEAEDRARREEREVRQIGLIARQRRFYNGGGRLLRAKGRWRLRVRDNPRVHHLWAFYAPELVRRE